MNVIKKIFSTLFSEGAFRIYCYFLILISAILAVDTGIKGDYSKMQNHINWVLWVGLVIVYSLNRELQEVKAKAYKEYSEALEGSIEEYKELVNLYKEKDVVQKQFISKLEEMREGQEKEIALLKKTQKASDKIIEQYKNNKESRF
jgi:hypothetical protein